MPEFIAVQCFQCRMFQVQQVKKKSSFTCVVCGGRQSVKKIYARSTMAKNIRIVVQDLNKISREAEEEFDVPEQVQKSSVPSVPSSKSKWNAFVEDHKTAQIVEDVPSDPDCEYITALPEKKRRKRKSTQSQTTQKVKVDDSKNGSKLTQFFKKESEIKAEAQKIVRKPVITSSPKWTNYVEHDNNTERNEEHNNSIDKRNMTTSSSKWTKFTEKNVEKSDNELLLDLDL